MNVQKPNKNALLIKYIELMSKIKIDGLPKGYKTYTHGTLMNKSKTFLATMVHDMYHTIADLNTRVNLAIEKPQDLGPDEAELTRAKAKIAELNLEVHQLKIDEKAGDAAIEVLRKELMLCKRPWWKKLWG